MHLIITIILQEDERMKKIISVIFILTIILNMAFGLSLSASAESLYIRKIVSVVYDDSGSMEGDKWANANYAMQTFCGMLNSEDQLYITYMSRSKKVKGYSPENIDLSTRGIQSSVDTIRNHTESSSTPFKAVEMAYNKLKSINDSNVNTQYWLVVITDGDFDEIQDETKQKKKDFLNEKLGKFADSKIPNGTYPQITFLGIGDVASPDKDSSKGIYTYSSAGAGGIIGAMAEMADRISGRTRLDKNDVKKTDDKTIQVSSSIPLLNIAVLVQGSKAKITDVIHNNEKNIPILRTASLSYPQRNDLVGGAYLLGNSGKVIESGTYNITFDQNVDLKDVVVLFEPALEMRMTISANGKTVSDLGELDKLSERDKISVSCKIYEMGTNKEIPHSLMPSGTKYSLSVIEDGKVTEQSKDHNMTVSDYSLKNVKTEIKAAVSIKGFNPIEHSVKFTPLKYVPQITYSISSFYENNVKSIRYDDVAGNRDFSIGFIVYADGNPITDADAVKALKPSVDVSPDGNGGTVTYSDDGRIIFTPNAASIADKENTEVSVTCKLENGVSATGKYNLVMADYLVVPVEPDEKIKKTEFYGNQVSASFYVTKDGTKLDKPSVENMYSVLLNEQHSELKTDVSVADDGTITVTPYSEENYVLTFANWWINWYRYFNLEGDDLVVTLDHKFASADAVIDVVEEDIGYQILNVYLPLLIELAALAVLITWIILVITKPRYLKSAVLYVGDIKYNKESCTHVVRNFSAVRLDKFNKVKKGNGRLKFKRTADVVSANGLKIRADHGGRVVCEMLFPWYKSKVEPYDPSFAELNTPAEISDYIVRNRKLEINEFATTETIEGDYERVLVAGNPRTARYIVVPDSGNGVSVVEGRKVIRSGKIFIYVNG